MDNLQGVFAVPPLARKSDGSRRLDHQQNEAIARHLMKGGITRVIYGGNAFLYHITLTEYEELLDWLSTLADELSVFPSIGPSYGRAMDQAQLLRRHSFPAVMILPSSDPRDASGLEQGYREIAEASGLKLIVYLKDENNFGSDHEAGLDAVARLVDDGVCVAIKYAVVRPDPATDPYLERLLALVDRNKVISGIGERPAIVHLRDWQLTGFTTGSGCLAPRSSQALFDACSTGDWNHAEGLRARFIPLEDLRDAWGPARVLHAATDAAGIAGTGPLLPYVSALSAEQIAALTPVAQSLLAADNHEQSQRASGD